MTNNFEEKSKKIQTYQIQNMLTRSEIVKIEALYSVGHYHMKKISVSFL